jgi:hypothetical protein
MIVQVNNATIHRIAGPPDLGRYGRGDRLIIRGEISEMDRATWAIAIGLFVMRGGSV